jgi:zinc protease
MRMNLVLSGFLIVASLSAQTPAPATGATPPMPATATKPEIDASATKVTGPLPSADTVLQHYVDVTGGAKAYDAAKTMVGTGKFVMPAQGITGDLTMYSAAPNKSYALIDIQGVGKVEEGSDGAIAWEISPMTGARIKAGDEAAAEMRSSATDIHTNWKKYYKTVEVTGIDDVDGKPAYKLVLTPQSGSAETEWYDKDSGLVLKSTMTVDTPMGKAPVEIAFSDYKKEGDLTIPTKMVQSVAGQQFEIHLEKVDFNVPVPPNRFDIPADIKALQK